MRSTFPVDAGTLLGAVLEIIGVVVSGVADRYRLPGRCSGRSVGNRRGRRHGRGCCRRRNFHEGGAAAAEAVLFLMLGLLVFPSQLLDVFGLALIVALVLTLVARPIAVALCLPWFRFNRRELPKRSGGQSRPAKMTVAPLA